MCYNVTVVLCHTAHEYVMCVKQYDVSAYSSSVAAVFTSNPVTHVVVSNDDL
jgi:hypothetical protein